MKTKKFKNTYLISRNPEENSKIKYIISSVDTEDILNIVIKIGEGIDILGQEPEQKYYYCDACKFSGGKKDIFHLNEEEFVKTAFKLLDSKCLDDEQQKTIRKIKLNFHLLSEKYSLESFIFNYEYEYFSCWEYYHILYQFYKILDDIDSNRECTSKIWEFKNIDNKKLNNSEILDFTKEIFSKFILIRPEIRYDRKTDSIIYCFQNIVEVGVFMLYSKITTCGLKLKKKSNAKICSICGSIYIPTGNNQKTCIDCKKIATNNRQKRCRNKKKT